LSTVYGAGLYIAWVIAAAMLVSAAVERHPYSFYMLLRWICCPIFAYSAFAAHEKGRLIWPWVFGALAVLYNPIFRVHLDRSTWIGVNWFTVGVIIVAAVAFLSRRAQIWIAAATGLIVVSVGLWQLRPITRSQRLRDTSVPSSPVPAETATPSVASVPPTTPDQRVHALSKFQHAQQVFQQHDFPTARKLIDEADAKDPNQPAILNLRGQILTEQREYELAETAFRKAIEIDPNFYEAKKNLAAMLWKKDEEKSQMPSSAVTAQISSAESPTVVKRMPSAGSSSQSNSMQQQTARKPKIVYAPTPTYPAEADKMSVTGSGRFKITFDERGNARSVDTVQSTGNRILDSNTINALKRWRAAPGMASSVVVPIDYRQKQQSRAKPKTTTSQPDPHSNSPSFYPNYYSQPPPPPPPWSR
jgi:TonB family protein